MTDTYKILLFEKEKEIGYIIFHYDKLNILITSLYVYEKGQGYGSVLMIFFLCFIINNIHDSYYIKKISLDDCSDLACTKKSIYYKLGFRILDDRSMEIMRINFLKPSSSKKTINKQHKYNDDIFSSIVHFKSITDYYNHLLDIYKELLLKIASKDDILSFKIYKNKDGEYIYIKDLDIGSCLIKKENIKYSLRKSKMKST